MVAVFNMGGKLDVSIESLKFETRTLAIISEFFLAIFLGISVSWQALEVSNLKMSLRISSLCIFEKEKEVFGFCCRLLQQQVCWDGSYISIHLKTGSLILLAKGSELEYPSILRLLTLFEKKVFKTSAVLWSPMMISSFTFIVIF